MRRYYTGSSFKRETKSTDQIGEKMNKHKAKESGIIAAAILSKPELLGKALMQANCKKREGRLRVIVEMRLARVNPGK